MNISSTPKHRIEEVVLHVTDKQGNPIKNKELRFKQINHKFLFGCGAFDIQLYANKDEIEKKKSEDLTHMPNFDINFVKERVDKWFDVFNYGTLPFYWGFFEPKEGSPLTQDRMNTAKYMKERGAVAKGHPLCWHTCCADWLMDYDNDTIFKKQIERIHRDVTDFKGTIDMWDVINEVVIMPIFDKYDNAITRICKDKGRVGLVKEVFAAAKESNPDGIFLINDFNLSTNYEILIDGCLNAGVPINAIGLQTHQHQGYMGEEKLREVLKRYEHFGLPLHFTENTLISGDLMPDYIVDLNDWQVDEWPSTPEGEARQAKEWEEMYRILYDHPLVEAVTGWDFADGAWLNAPSGLIKKDNTLKPAYHKLKSMIKDEWWTDITVRTDDNGNVLVSGVRGEYELVDGDSVANITLSKGMEKNLHIEL